jgi:hypothetical protein
MRATLSDFDESDFDRRDFHAGEAFRGVCHSPLALITTPSGVLVGHCPTLHTQVSLLYLPLRDFCRFVQGSITSIKVWTLL